MARRTRTITKVYHMNLNNKKIYFGSSVTVGIFLAFLVLWGHWRKCVDSMRMEKYPEWYQLGERLETTKITGLGETNVPISVALNLVENIVKKDTGYAMSVVFRSSRDPIVSAGFTNAAVIDVLKRIAGEAEMVVRVEQRGVVVAEDGPRNQELAYMFFFPSKKAAKVFKELPERILEDGPARQWCYDGEKNLITVRLRGEDSLCVADVLRELGLVLEE